MSEKVAVVTGSNKGIGLAIVEGLCQKYDGIVYLTARDLKRIQEAVAKLKAKGLNPSFHQLDVTDQDLMCWLTVLVLQFRASKAGKCVEEGWGTKPYYISKAGVSALSIIQQKIFAKETTNRNISVNHVHPGYIDTDLSQHRGPNPVEYGASATLFTILEAKFKGQFVFENCEVVDWYGENIPPIKGLDLPLPPEVN